MRPLLIATTLAAMALSQAGRADDRLVKLAPVPFTNVRIKDRFWAPRQETNRQVSIPLNLEMLEKSGNFKNLELAATGARQGFIGPVFMDSDIYKALEAASYSLATHPDPALSKRLDQIIALLAAAQQPDGYLDTYYIVKEPGKQWTNLRDNHELYCAGHLFEAAVAHSMATGQQNFLTVARRLADHIDSVFGPGKRMGYPGHPEIELALVKLARATNEPRYLELARFFVENRGTKFFAEEHKTPAAEYDGTYWQDDVPICDHSNIKGHAVRAAYLLSGATDIAAETGYSPLLEMIDRVWKNTVRRNMYITGGIGPSASNEGFTHDYDLPNASAYQETCASVALAQWNHRLALLYGNSKYADVVERSLYNGVLAGVSLDGKTFFYVNPLESAGNHHRSPWFGCACCPPNVARTLASLGGYAYATGEGSVWFNLYIAGSVDVTLDDQKIRFNVETDYPWDGKVNIQPVLEEPASFSVRLRVPEWCRDASVSVNGQKVEEPRMDRGYLVLEREWSAEDKIELELPMPVTRVAANPNVEADHGLLATQRGPLIYCVEAADNPEGLEQLFIPASTAWTSEQAPTLLGGVTVLKTTGAIAAAVDWHNRLYQPATAPRSVAVTAIPYYAWDNRQAGSMKVWLPTAPAVQPDTGLEHQARVSLSFVSGNCQPWAINDGAEPRSSKEHPPAVCHWWPHRGGEEWAQYDWATPVTVSACRAYWFDDTGSGACRVPASWRIEYRDGAEWKPVEAKLPYPVAEDAWCRVDFSPVKTTALRLVVRMQDGWAAGVHEWRVEDASDD